MAAESLFKVPPCHECSGQIDVPRYVPLGYAEVVLGTGESWYFHWGCYHQWFMRTGGDPRKDGEEADGPGDD